MDPLPAWYARLARFARRHARQAAIAGLIVAFATPASAQYFGRNKVRYRSFDFQVLQTEHFEIYYYTGERAGIDVAARLAERWYTRLEGFFGRGLSDIQPLVLYASHADFEETNVVSEEIDEGTGGFTEPFRRRIVLPLAGPIADTEHVIGHELVHAFQFDLARHPGPRSAASLQRLPLWFIEGMAEYVSLGPVDANTAMRLRDAARRDKLPSIHALASPRFFPYQWGHAVLAYIGGRFGDASIPRLLSAAAASGDVEKAINDVLGVSAKQLSTDWHEAIRKQYAPFLAAAGGTGDSTRLRIDTPGLGTELTIAPALSPDGKSIAFLSARSLFSIDLYVADVETRRVVRKLTSTSTNGHYSSIQFINSAGAWDAASEHIVLATVTGGQPALAILNARTGKRDRDIPVSAVDEILNPAWSPDGHAIAFTGMREGLTDLFIYDVETNTLRQVTNDPYADLHPAWSPDGRRIVFASDRFDSSLDSFRIGPLQLAVVDVETGAIEAVPAFSNGKQINPQWSVDGRSVYFIADPDGVPNVYRLSLEPHTIEPITASATGVSGITRSSPALSVSTASARIAFSVFEDDQYHLYVLDSARPLEPRPTLDANAAALPPIERRGGTIAAMLANSEEGVASPEDFSSAPYKPSLKLAGFSQPTGGVGVSRFGASVGGGAAMFFSDLLGDRLLATAVQVNSGVAGSFSVNDIAVETAYFNLNRRWNWGLIGSQLPYLAGTYQTGLTTLPGGQLVGIDREVILRQTQRNVGAMAAYPFDRTRRLEVQGGFAETSFERITNSVTFVPATGKILSDKSVTEEFASRLDLVTAGVALVSDTANFGAAGPVRGQRYRLELAPAVGTINFTGMTVDYRRYVMPVSFYTVAFRVLHYGRYGEGSDDARLFPVYINNPGLVRGYDATYYLSSCLLTATGLCQVNDPLAGSRILVSNLELRFPLLRPLGVSRAMYGPLPTEIAIFTDGGVAWTAREKPALVGGTRPAITSVGIAFRTSVDVAVFEFDLTRPLRRQGEGWVFGFNVIPAW